MEKKRFFQQNPWDRRVSNLERQEKGKLLNWKAGFDLEMTQWFPIMMLPVLWPILFPHSFSNILTSGTGNLSPSIKICQKCHVPILRQTPQRGVWGPSWTYSAHNSCFASTRKQHDVTPGGSACRTQNRTVSRFAAFCTLLFLCLGHPCLFSPRFIPNLFFNGQVISSA